MSGYELTQYLFGIEKRESGGLSLILSGFGRFWLLDRSALGFGILAFYDLMFGLGKTVFPIT